MPDPSLPTQSDSPVESFRERLSRLESECCTCKKCGHIQAEPNWCHRCRHRVEMPEWAVDLLGEREAEKEARVRAEEALEAIAETAKRYWSKWLP